MKCDICQFFVEAKEQCHRYPRVYEKKAWDFCGEFREVVKVEVFKVVEESNSKRGWPRGRPRK